MQPEGCRLEKTLLGGGDRAGGARRDCGVSSSIDGVPPDSTGTSSRSVLRHVDWSWLLPAITLVLATYVGRALRWEIMLRPLRKDPNLVAHFYSDVHWIYRGGAVRPGRGAGSPVSDCKERRCLVFQPDRRMDRGAHSRPADGAADFRDRADPGIPQRHPAGPEDARHPRSGRVCGRADWVRRRWRC